MNTSFGAPTPGQKIARSWLYTSIRDEGAGLAAQIDTAIAEATKQLVDALSFADSVIYSEFCTGKNADGSPKIALDGYEVIQAALAAHNAAKENV